MKTKIEKIEKFERDMLCGKNLYVYRKQGYTSYKLHWHSYFEIIYYKNCHGSCTLNGKNYPVTKSCIFFLTPKDFHRIDTEDNANQTAINLSFTEQYIDIDIIKKVSDSPRVVYDPPEYLTGIFELIYNEFNAGKKSSEFNTRQLLNYILSKILQFGKSVGFANKYITPRIGDTIAHIISNPTQKFSLGDAAKRVGMSEAYFSDLFHKETGTTFIKYTNRLKIEHAKRLLEQDIMSVIDIGYECGFNSVSNFIRTFRQYECVPPSEYRKKFRNSINADTAKKDAD